MPSWIPAHPSYTQQGQYLQHQRANKTQYLPMSNFAFVCTSVQSSNDLGSFGWHSVPPSSSVSSVWFRFELYKSRILVLTYSQCILKTITCKAIFISRKLLELFSMAHLEPWRQLMRCSHPIDVLCWIFAWCRILSEALPCKLIPKNNHAFIFNSVAACSIANKKESANKASGQQDWALSNLSCALSHQCY